MVEARMRNCVYEVFDEIRRSNTDRPEVDGRFGAYGYEHYYQLLALAIKEIDLPAREICVLSVGVEKTDERQKLFVVVAATRIKELVGNSDNVPAYIITVDPNDIAWDYRLFRGPVVAQIARLLMQNVRHSLATFDYQVVEYLAAETIRRVDERLGICH